MKLEEILEKLKHMDHLVVPIILDGAAMSESLSQKYLTEITDTKVRLELNTRKTSFEINGNTYFMLFCLAQIIKCVRNNLMEKNYFKCPGLKDEGKIIIMAGMHDVKFVTELHNITVHNLLSDINFSKKACCLSSIYRQQEAPTLMLFS